MTHIANSERSPVMMRTSGVGRGLSATIVGMLLWAKGNVVGSQEPRVPVDRLQPLAAADSMRFGSIFGVRELADGRLLVNDAGARRLLLLSADLRTVSVVLDSTNQPDRWYGPLGSGILPYAGDTTLFVIAESQGLLLITPDGQKGRTMALPRPVEPAVLSGALFGGPRIDAEERLIYRLNPRATPTSPGPSTGEPTTAPGMLSTPDSAAVVRLSLRTRQLDTLAWVRVPQTLSVLETTPQGRRRRVIRNPLPKVDDWVALSDGSVAIMRGHDYHLEIVGPDGLRSQSAKIPFDWRALDDTGKRALLDSMRRTTPPSTDPRVAIDFVGVDDLPDYVPPLRPNIRNVFVDLRDHLWVLPSTSRGATDGLLYDVIAREGRLERRVQFPQGRFLIGFGANSAVYVVSRDPKGGILLERMRPSPIEPAKRDDR